MEFEVISKMKKTDGTNQLKVINDFKDRVIKYGNKKLELQNKIDQIYGDIEINKIDDSLENNINSKTKSFMEQFEFKEPILKRKRKDIEKENKSKKEQIITSERITKAREDFHKSLNLCKDNLELEMMFEDPNDKKNKIKSSKLEYDPKKKKYVQKENKTWFKNEAGVKVNANDKFGKYKKWSQNNKTKISRVFEREGKIKTGTETGKGGVLNVDQMVKQKKGEIKKKIKHERVSMSKKRKEKKTKKARQNRQKNKK